MRKPSPLICSVEQCQRPQHARGFCTMHYQKWKAHGDPSGGRDAPKHGLQSQYPAEYRVWKNMKERCYREANKSFDHYGARGITVDDRWKNDFPAFLADMGPRPSPAHSIDRKDNDGPYSATNCRWATKPEQMANRSDNHRVCLDGEWMIVTEAARRLGRDLQHVLRRLDSGDVYRPTPRMRAARKAIAPETEAEILRALHAGARKIEIERKHGITNRHVNDIIRRSEQL